MMLKSRISGSLFLSTMLNLNDAAYCVAHGAGAGMVQLGTMLATPETAEYHPYRERWPKAFLPQDGESMRRFLAAELEILRQQLGDVVVCLSIGGFDVAELVPAAEAFAAVGGELLELNVHGGLQPWSDQGYLGGMSLPAYRERLVQWVERLAQVDVPLLVKLNTHFDVDFEQICQQLAHVSLAGYHFNVRDEETKEPKYGFVREIRPAVEGMLLVSGYAWTSEMVRKLYAAGADAVGVAQPVMKNAAFIQELAAQLD